MANSSNRQMPSEGEQGRARATRPRLGRRAHVAVMTILQAILGVELLLLIASGRWMHVFLVLCVIAVTLAPELLRRRLEVEIPSEIQILAVLFVFASLFLGEVHDYYERIWWWDLALHGTAGLLLGLLGFLIVHVLNQSGRVDLHLRPSFVALFAFLFGLGIGTLWEIFEFAMDRLFGLTMQKPTEGDPSGLTDTMWDLIVDALGAGIVAIAGWRYLAASRRRYVDTWVGRFIRRNRRFLRPRRGRRANSRANRDKSGQLGATQRGDGATS